MRTTAEEGEKTNSDSVSRGQGFHVLNMTSDLTFQRMLRVRLPALPPVLLLGGEFVMLVQS